MRTLKISLPIKIEGGEMAGLRKGMGGTTPSGGSERKGPQRTMQEACRLRTAARAFRNLDPAPSKKMSPQPNGPGEEWIPEIG